MIWEYIDVIVSTRGCFGVSSKIDRCAEKGEHKMR